MKRWCASLLQATRTAAAVFTVLIGALIFGYFLTVTQTPQKVTEFLTSLGLGSYGILALIMLMYLVLGCLMDAMAMIILTVPIIFPVDHRARFDPIWFGVIIVMTVELGLIHPPVGMNVFVIKSVVKDVSFTTIFKGVLPFVATDLVRLVILIAFPMLASSLPQAYGELSMTPELVTKYVFTITAHIGAVTSAGDVGHGRSPHYPDYRRRGARRGDHRQGLSVRRGLPDHPAQRTDRTRSQIRLRDR